MRETREEPDVQTILVEWARWASTDRGIGYPNISAFYRMSKAGGWSSGSMLIDDEFAGRIDWAVTRLRLRCKGHREDMRYKVLCRAYLGRQPDYAIASKLRCDRRTVKTARIAAESWVESAIISTADYQLVPEYG